MGKRAIGPVEFAFKEMRAANRLEEYYCSVGNYRAAAEEEKRYERYYEVFDSEMPATSRDRLLKLLMAARVATDICGKAYDSWWETPGTENPQSAFCSALRELLYMKIREAIRRRPAIPDSLWVSELRHLKTLTTECGSAATRYIESVVTSVTRPRLV